MSLPFSSPGERARLPEYRTRHPVCTFADLARRRREGNRERRGSVAIPTNMAGHARARAEEAQERQATNDPSTSTTRPTEQQQLGTDDNCNEDERLTPDGTGGGTRTSRLSLLVVSELLLCSSCELLVLVVLLVVVDCCSGCRGGRHIKHECVRMSSGLLCGRATGATAKGSEACVSKPAVAELRKPDNGRSFNKFNVSTGPCIVDGSTDGP